MVMKDCWTIFCWQRSTYKKKTADSNGSISKNDSADKVTPLATAGFFSDLMFSWLNPLMHLGKKKTLEEQDVPKMREIDRAGCCYTQFLDELSRRKKGETLSESLILWSIVACHRREILLSGFFALLKTISVSAGPLLLYSFIKVYEGKETFRHQSYVLAASLFLSKMVESLSQRQWYFRSTMIGLRIRSMLMAAVYRKQQKLPYMARRMYSGGEIMNFVTVDSYRVGELPFWFHNVWTTPLQLCLALMILVNAIGLATVATIAAVILTVLCNAPIARSLHKFQAKWMVPQDVRLKACSEALVNMKVLKLYAWETHFMNVIETLRKVELKCLLNLQLQRQYMQFLFWMSPIMVSAFSFLACYFLRIPLHASNVFTVISTLRLVQEPVRYVPDVTAVFIAARIAFGRIVKFLLVEELETENARNMSNMTCTTHSIMIKSANLSWEDPSKPSLRNINLDVHPGEKIAICGEVGSGKSTFLAAILGELPCTDGTVEVFGSVAYVSQAAWIQTGTIRENIAFGSAMDDLRYKETLNICSLEKDLENLPFGDETEIGERGVNLSGGQKQRIQLARALYQDADIYLLDDPFSAVDAHTASSLFNEYVLRALSGKTVLLVTHQVDFLPAFDCCLLMSDGEILQVGTYHELLDSSQKFLDLVNAHKETAGEETLAEVGTCNKQTYSTSEIQKENVENEDQTSKENQLIKKEVIEVAGIGFKPLFVYMSQSRGYWSFSILVLAQSIFLAGQTLQNIWMAKAVNNPHISQLKMILVYVILGLISTFWLLVRSLAMNVLGAKSSKALFSKLLISLFRAPMSFYDSTPLGRILSRLAADLSIIDLDLPFSIVATVGQTSNAYSIVGLLAAVVWQVLIVAIPVIYMAIRLQMYYFATASALMRLNGTTKSMVANHLSESIAGSMTIRAFHDEERFFAKNLNLIDTNASPFFHNFAASQWLIMRVELLSAMVLAAATLFLILLPPGTFRPGFIGMALSYGLSLNLGMVFSIQSQNLLFNRIISVERLSQYMNLLSEAPEIISDNRPDENWPSVGKVEIYDLQIRYRPNTPLVLKGITCTFEGGNRIGIVGRTGSGKTTLIGALFRLVEPEKGKIVVDGVDICSIGLHDLRSRFGIIPQEPTLFNGTVRYNLDPLGKYTDDEIWEVLEKCQLKESVKKEQGLDSSVMEDGSNWSMGQRQLFCLGRALLKRSRVLVLDEATASIDNQTDMIIQKTVRSEFADCTVITIAHRIPTVMDCTKVLAISDGNLVECDDPKKLMQDECSLFGQLVKEYWSHYESADQSESHVDQ